MSSRLIFNSLQSELLRCYINDSTVALYTIAQATGHVLRSSAKTTTLGEVVMNRLTVWDLDLSHHSVEQSSNIQVFAQAQKDALKTDSQTEPEKPKEKPKSGPTKLYIPEPLAQANIPPTKMQPTRPTR